MEREKVIRVAAHRKLVRYQTTILSYSKLKARKHSPVLPTERSFIEYFEFLQMVE
jgi:hypothetical protein